MLEYNEQLENWIRLYRIDMDGWAPNITTYSMATNPGPDVEDKYTVVLWYAMTKYTKVYQFVN